MYVRLCPREEHPSGRKSWESARREKKKLTNHNPFPETGERETVQGNEAGGSRESERKSCPDGRLRVLEPELCSTMGFLVSQGNLLLLLCASVFPGKFEKAFLPLLCSLALFSLSPLKGMLRTLVPISEEFPPLPHPPAPSLQVP